MNRVKVNPELLRWAYERAGRNVDELSKRFPKLEQWESGEVMPTLKQVEAFAKATYVSIGYLFLSEPPTEHVPIPDLRTVGNRGIGHPSPDLLDTLHLCQQRQTWYRDHAQRTGQEPLAFVGSANLDSPIEETAAQMRRVLGFDIEARQDCRTWTDALRMFIEQADDIGVMVMCSGVVGSNNNRKLDPEEFRGFALADTFAPLVFINGADSKAAQMFTLAHELVHILLGESALSDVCVASAPSQKIEIWCNRVAAEFLVPLRVLEHELQNHEPLSEISRLARYFKVSTLVILRRIFDTKRISRQVFQGAYEAELARLRAIPKGSGGNFYLTMGARASKRFARELVVATLEGHTSFTEAFRLLGVKKMTTFRDIGNHLGIGI